MLDTTSTKHQKYEYFPPFFSAKQQNHQKKTKNGKEGGGCCWFRTLFMTLNFYNLNQLS